MLRRLLYPAIGLFIIACLFFGEDMWKFITGDPIRDVQDWAQGIMRAFNQFISG
ncbi:hypothetical protein AB4152_10190 [Vibrio breoganii]|uniref:Uncharacterized protein n=1 Tax=Vibrio breoganii TaxID=553239 RepID=A0ABX1UB58_9VIBR|nr:hypothetical protein [Vibrio breoganii]NMO73585.1 hypothetical protein [Vibrio breoganii]NMR70713.1 hypothetical protein [Vibrio breoganii]